jgi:hypothetical protein
LESTRVPKLCQGTVFAQAIDSTSCDIGVTPDGVV